ncbi:hypothetical protein A2617_04950 [Candidatus Daviesbacteria bacterium RIFOXYD1_FULL_41_10]|uniref:Uncharacterized protein n=2 Tax=Candidatus Daviesiibacteriota TaxID=1752718 RepID=A0A1F5N3E0_9BACT|nr:MAG: hypothetical protein UU67_C0027G0008 [Candidatus Daviesbacteria bacterium GW2011_GWB1_41_5]OGE71990.1 MAG: hypothetical protein A2617_04950 [Candidatus Daviesbacteria bacterium RIFOXYD1_FULL_41_10]
MDKEIKLPSWLTGEAATGSRTANESEGPVWVPADKVFEGMDERRLGRRERHGLAFLMSKRPGV